MYPIFINFVYSREPSEKAIVQAIFNVKQYYAVVGVLEEYSKFIEVLEYVLPSYFRGAPKVFDALCKYTPCFSIIITLC